MGIAFPLPGVRLIRALDLKGLPLGETRFAFKQGETETDAYMRIVEARYLLLRTHDWIQFDTALVAGRNAAAYPALRCDERRPGSYF